AKLRSGGVLLAKPGVGLTFQGFLVSRREDHAQAFAVRSPDELADRALKLRELTALSAVHGNDVQLALAAAARKEGNLPAIRAEARAVVIALALGELSEAAASRGAQPDVAVLL